MIQLPSTARAARAGRKHHRNLPRYRNARIPTHIHRPTSARFRNARRRRWVSGVSRHRSGMRISCVRRRRGRRQRRSMRRRHRRRRRMRRRRRRRRSWGGGRVVCLGLWGWGWGGGRVLGFEFGMGSITPFFSLDFFDACFARVFWGMVFW